MKAEWIKSSLCLLCLSVATVVAGQSKASSVFVELPRKNSSNNTCGTFRYRHRLPVAAETTVLAVDA